MTKKQIEAKEKRAKLSALSAKIKMMMEQGHFQDCERVNEAIQSVYETQEGREDFSSSWGWNEQGMKVKKGEKGFPVWGRPRKFTAKIEDVATGEDAEKAFKAFPLAYIFHGGQVEEMSEKHVEFFAKKQAKAKENKAKREAEEERKTREAIEAHGGIFELITV